jgi:hypothetical protein
MTSKSILLGIMGAGLFLPIAQQLPLAAQQPFSSGVFTGAQAQAGRIAYERTCGQCHTTKLSGRKGTGQQADSEELPPIGSLSASYQKFIGPRGFVAPLAGKVFLDRWGQKTAGELIARFQETVDDPYFKFEDMNEETTVNITAYVLQVNGASPGTQPLTRSTGVVVNSITH